MGQSAANLDCSCRVYFYFKAYIMDYCSVRPTAIVGSKRTWHQHRRRKSSCYSPNTCYSTRSGSSVLRSPFADQESAVFSFENHHNLAQTTKPTRIIEMSPIKSSSSKLVSRLRDDVPEHLRDGAKFRSLLNFTEPIFAPSICMKFTLDVNDQHAFSSMLWTLHYWGVTTLPSNAIAFALTSPSCLTEDRDIEFLTSSIPSLLILIKLVGYPKSEWLQYAMQDGDLHVVRHLIEREGLLWNEHCALAAIQYNHLECLKYACVTQCPLSSNVYDLLARGEGNDCVKFLRRRLNLTNTTSMPEMERFRIADYQYALWGLAVVSLSGLFVGKLLNRA